MVINKLSFLVTALLWLVSLVPTGADESLVELRHHAPSFKRDADGQYAMRSESALVVSPCRPELDGFFGGTSSKHGSPILFDYVFQMESAESANLKEALTVIYDRVVDSILSQSFPSICSIQRRMLEEQVYEKSSRVTGFKFSVPEIDLNERCDPFLDPNNLCGYFKGKVQVFGRNLIADETVPELMQIALDTVEDAQASVSDLGVVRLIPSSKLSKSTNGTIPEYAGSRLVEDESGYSMTPVAKASFVVVSFTFILGVVCLVMWVSNDLKRHRNVKILEHSKSIKNGNFSLLHCFRPQGTYSDDDTSHSPIDAIYLQDDYSRGEMRILPSLSDLDYVFEDNSQAESPLHAHDYKMDPRASFT